MDLIDLFLLLLIVQPSPPLTPRRCDCQPFRPHVPAIHVPASFGVARQRLPATQLRPHFLLLYGLACACDVLSCLECCHIAWRKCDPAIAPPSFTLFIVQKSGDLHTAKKEIEQ